MCIFSVTGNWSNTRPNSRMSEGAPSETRTYWLITGNSDLSFAFVACSYVVTDTFIVPALPGSSHRLANTLVVCDARASA